MMSFEIQQEAFSGPLELLLELLEKQELEIKDVHLARVADSFIERLDSQNIAPEEMADFLVVASRLIYLKSRQLLPYLRIEEEEERVETLEDQLRLYRLFKDAADRLEAQFAKPVKSYLRPYAKVAYERTEEDFSVPKNITVIGMHQAFYTLLRRLEPFLALRQVSLQRVKSVQERLDELKDVLMTRAKIRFTDVVPGASSRVEVVVSFLALLELMRCQVVRVKQQGHDIMIERM